MRSRRPEFFRSRRVGRVVRWLWPTALLALTPKCLLCVAAYAGLGAVLGWRGPEMCGASAGLPASWASSLAWLGAGFGLGGIGFLVTRWRRRRAPPAFCTGDQIEGL